MGDSKLLSYPNIAPDRPGGHADPGGLEVCGLLTCLLGRDSVRQLLKRHEIDFDEVTACVKRACR